LQTSTSQPIRSSSSALFNLALLEQQFFPFHLLCCSVSTTLRSWTLSLISSSTNFEFQQFPHIPSLHYESAMNIESLLNPVRDSTATRVVDNGSPPATRPRSSTSTTAQSRLKTQKLAKDAPVFRKGQPKGEVQFPPHEAGHNAELLAQHMKFQVFPMGEIASYVHRIPYSSDKKMFLEKTGRDAFEGTSMRV
jgi:hypothetical protein